MLHIVLPIPVLLLILVPPIFWIVEFGDVLRRRFPVGSTKIVWVLVVLFLHFVGALFYYLVGKKQGTLAA